MAKLKRRKIPIEIDDKIYEVGSPTLGQLESIESFKDDKEAAKGIENLLVSLGLPLEVVKSLDGLMIGELFEILSGKKRA